jgi:hypothetical protein
MEYTKLSEVWARKSIDQNGNVNFKYVTGYRVKGSCKEVNIPNKENLLDKIKTLFKNSDLYCIDSKNKTFTSNQPIGEIDLNNLSNFKINSFFDNLTTILPKNGKIFLVKNITDRLPLSIKEAQQPIYDRYILVDGQTNEILKEFSRTDIVSKYNKGLFWSNPRNGQLYFN